MNPLLNRWALVTGASSGIGAAIARELAGQGAKLILTARRTDRLEALAKELSDVGTEVRVLSADLADAVAPQRLFDATEGAGIAVDILINNAGLGQFGAFHTNIAEQEAAQVRVNCESVVRLSRLFVPRMVERGQGWVLVVASTASFQPVPYMATYAATKVFDRFFAQALAEEVAQFGVKVTALCPGPTESEFFSVAHAEVLKKRGVQGTAEVARIAVRALVRGRRNVIPNFSGRAMAFMVRFLPVSWITRLIAGVVGSSRGFDSVGRNF